MLKITGLNLLLVEDENGEEEGNSKQWSGS
jgi:hypothetical protein